MNQNKVFKILSIDGGGIKGLYSASVLSKIEEKTGKKISDNFQMICGTSTGGIIALGLAKGLTADELVNFYINKGPKIFSTFKYRLIEKLNRKLLFIKQLLIRSKFSNKELEKALIEVFGDSKLSDLKTLLCIPSFNLSTGKPRVFKNSSNTTPFFRDGNLKIVDVALSTSAAPTYFPVHSIDEDLYVDGGVWANNPALCGLFEALEHYVGEGKEYETYEILSISSISIPSGWTYTSNKSKSFSNWKHRIFDTTLDGQSFFTDHFLKNMVNKITPKGNYIRINSPELSKKQIETIEMDKADKIALKTLKSLGDNVGYNYATNKSILDMFNN
ncbi:MAG: CBASS cGAMP-activated phospholipase [Bacteroidota bacterium]